MIPLERLEVLKTVEIEDDVDENIEEDEFSTNEDIENSVDIDIRRRFRNRRKCRN